MLDLSGDVLAAIDFETTGRQAGFHEPIQIAIVPLGASLRPLAAVRPFYMHIRPEFPERAEPQAGQAHGIGLQWLQAAPSAGDVAGRLSEWVRALELPLGKRLVPLAHNWAFEASFLGAWLGSDYTAELFHGHARDSMLTAIAINDARQFVGLQRPFPNLALDALCRFFGICNLHPHNALWDALVEAEVYRRLLLFANCFQNG